jgi:threonine aldolase
MYESNSNPISSNVVDLRSDTVTRPTPAMYEAMMSAPLGDDVLGDDPTVLKLEALAAQKLGKEAALFVPTGTMGNQIAIAVHGERGDAMLIEEEAHILYYECGMPAIGAGLVSWTLPSRKGVMDPAVIESRILKRNLHTPGTTLLCLENTHNRAGGTIIPLESMRAYRQVADRHGMKIHLDGARVFNAAVALNVEVSEIAQHVDSVNFCLSKGLASPVGSVLCGSRAFIEEARMWRKRLGGGMRQAGILAACGMVSLTQMVDRLSQDHRRAKEVAQAISGLDGLSVDLETVQTNIVAITTDGPSQPWIDALRDQGIWCLPPAPNRMRLVFHNDVDDAGAQRAIEAFQLVAGTVRAAS